MARIITIPNDNDKVMNAERKRIVPWAPSHSWIYAGYNHEADHLVQIGKAAGGQSPRVLDLDCHGSPTTFDHTHLAGAYKFGVALSKIPGFSNATEIYLDACNTGLISSINGGPIAQSVADGAGCTVYGTKGYMTGTYAEGNEKCYKQYGGHAAYPGAVDASGSAVWKAFRPTLVGGTAGVLMNGAPTIAVSDADRDSPKSEIVAVVETAVSSKPVDFPMLRMAPDVTINYSYNDNVRILDVYANGSLLKDRIEDVAWQIPTHSLQRFQAALRQALEIGERSE